MICYSILEDRGVVAVSGPDARPFLQAIISNDASKISPEAAIYAALLTPQGKFLHDFIIVQNGDEFLLDTEKHRVPDLLERLQLFRLGSDVSINSKMKKKNADDETRPPPRPLHKWRCKCSMFETK